MATQQEMEATYNYMAEIFRLSLGETGDRRVERSYRLQDARDWLQMGPYVEGC
jgi:hypothetical protein